MNQNVLTTFSIVAINQHHNNKKYYLTNKSFVRDQIFLNSQLSDKDYQNCLFYVEIDENSRSYKSSIEFGQKIYFRHKISNKYLSHSEDFEEQQNDTTYELRLSHQKHFFKILPCFQYQTKISSKIRFNEEVQLVTDVSGAKTGYISSRQTQQQHLKKTIVGINSFGTNMKFTFHSYYQFEKDEINYTFGSIFWLQHVESQTFLSVKKVNNKKQLVFEMIDQQKDLQSINGLWLIQSDNMGVGGRLSFEQSFKLKNLAQQTYASFTKGYKMVENERIYGMVLEQIPTKQSNFNFKSLKEQQNLIKKGSYLIFTNQQTKYFIGARNKNLFDDTQILKPISYRQFTDEDLYKLVQLNQNEQQAIRFILSIGHQLKLIEQFLNSQTKNKHLKQGKQIFTNIKDQLQKLKKYDKLFQKVQGQMKRYISFFSILLKKYRGKLGRHGEGYHYITEIVTIIYCILVIICSQNRENQVQSFKYIDYFVEDIFLDVEAQQLLIVTFKDNQQILCKLPNKISQNKNNLVRVCLNIIKNYSNNKNAMYWRKTMKFISLLKILITNGSTLIDINQRLISQEFFFDNDFEIVFFGLKVINNRIKVQSQPRHYIQLQRVRNNQMLEVIQQIFKLFSMLCSQRNFISKKYVNNLLNSNQQNTIEVLIAYLSMPIPAKLINNIYSLITNLYIDSSPRIQRIKPLGLINFVIDHNSQKDRISMREDTQIIDKLNSMMQFKAQQAYQTKPLQFSNLLSFTVKMSMQPSLTNQQLALYKQQILQKINAQQISLQLLKSLKTLIALQSINGKQILQINSLLSKKLREGELTQNITIGIMQIFIEVATYSKQVQLKKLGNYLKYKYLKKQTNINYAKQYQYLLPYNKRIYPSKKYSNSINNAILKYNNQTDMMTILSPNDQIKQILLELLIKSCNKSTVQIKNNKQIHKLHQHQQINNDEYLQKLFQCYNTFNFRQKQFLTIVMNSIVLTSEELPIFDNLFDYYKKLKHLVAISEYWLIGSSSNDDNLKMFIKYLTQVTYYLHKDYHQTINDDQKPKILNKYTGTLVKQEQVYVNRQLLLRNLGFHQVILQLIKPNHYLLVSNTSLNDQKNEQNLLAQKIFSLCFEFLYGFIYNCRETKQILHKQNTILLSYQQRQQVGQTRILRELYRGKIQYIGEINRNSIEQIVHKRILLNPKSKNNQGNQFDPLYLNFMGAIIYFDQKIYRPNLQKFYRVIEKDIYFRKIVFAKQTANRKLQFCINIFDIKIIDTIQVPFLYHAKILTFLADMHKQLQSQSAIISSKIRDMFDLEYLIQQLYSMDIYTHSGVQAQMRFIFKQSVMKIVKIYLQKNDSINILSNSESLMRLVKFYTKTFLDRPQKQHCNIANEALYIPFLKQYGKILKFYENNQRHYFMSEVKPFIESIYRIFIKSKKQNHPICQGIKYILENYRKQQMIQNYQYRQIDKKTDKIAFKWLNYVDNDENNGPQQKFAKLAVVDLLRHKEIQKIIDHEKQTFYGKTICKQKKNFAYIMLKLIENIMGKKSLEHEAEFDYIKIYKYLEQLYDLLQSIDHPNQKQLIVNFLLQKDLYSMLIAYTTKAQFDYKKNIAKKIYLKILKILILTMNAIPQQKAIKDLYKKFNQTTTAALYRFWQYLHQVIFVIKLAVQKQTIEEQINQYLQHIYFIVQERKQNTYDDGLKFVQTLCQYAPFTNFLRHQPYTYSIDFLEIMNHSLSYIICRQGQKVSINTTMSNAAQKLAQAISSMMFDGNQVNQNFLIDNKYPQIIAQVLKYDKIKKTEDNLMLVERQRLVNYVLEFYQKNGIDISESIRKRIAIKDFSNSYILNRLKYQLLHTLLQCLAANQMAMNKIRFQISVQLLKINLIWVYQDFLQCKQQITQSLILRQLGQWDVLVDNQNLQEMFLMNGFYIYYLIVNSEQIEQNNEDEDDAVMDDKQKYKQKIVKKFFGAISQKQTKSEKMKKLQKQPFAEEMQMYYKKYYEALSFFQKFTLNIEVNFNQTLTKVYFPKIPLCDKMTDRMMQQFQDNAVRISQQEKIKSLILFEEESYDFLQGQQDFFKKFHKIPVAQIFIRKLNEDFLRIVALLMCFIQTILFMVEDFILPSFVFTDKMYTGESLTILQVIIKVIGGINLTIGFLLAFYLIFKKMPIFIEVVSMRQRKRDQNQRQMFLQGKYSYIISEIAPVFLFTLIYIGLLIATFFHPLFAGFILFDIMSRLQLGRQIMRSIRETWVQLMGTIVLLIVINYCYAVYVYIQFTPFFSPTCQYLFQCLLLLLDQSLKSDSGFLGSVPVQYGKNVFDLKFFSEILYIIFAQKVIFEIFSGTIIDKFSELRENKNDIEQDQSSFCYICGQQNFFIDFQLEGFDKHIQESHNVKNYIFYLFYLRRKDPRGYGIIEKNVSECQKKGIKKWIPNQTSIQKVMRQKQKVNEDEQEQIDKIKQYLEKKVREAKQIRFKSDQILSQLKLNVSKLPQ